MPQPCEIVQVNIDMKMATGDAPIEMTPIAQLSTCRHWRKASQAERIPDHVPMPAKVTEVD
jgi:hypothetical protein